MILRVLFLTSWLLASLCQGQGTITRAEIEGSITKHVGVLVEFFSTDAVTAHALAASDYKQSARVALKPMIADGTAKIEEIAYLITRSGSQAQVESIVELIYPTEYHPPNTPQSIVGPIMDDGQIRTRAAPTAYQTRNLGLTLRMTPQVGPNPKLIELDLVIDQCEHAGTDTNGQLEALVTWPKIHSKQTTNTLLISSGKTKLVGVLAPMESESGRRILAFVQATTLPTMTVEQAAAMWFPGRTLVQDKPVVRAGPDNGDPFAGLTSDTPFKQPDLPDANITLLIESIEVQENLISGLLETPLNSTEPTSLREAVAELIKKGQASLKESHFVSSKSGLRAESRSGNEHIYAVEMSAPEMPVEVEGPIGKNVRLAVPMVYSTHEMRPDGFELSFHPHLSLNHQVIDLNLSLSNTHLLEKIAYGKGLAEATMPLYATERLATNLALLRDDCSLVGITSQRAKDGSNPHRYTFYFATTHVR